MAVRFKVRLPEKQKQLLNDYKESHDISSFVVCIEKAVSAFLLKEEKGRIQLVNDYIDDYKMEAEQEKIERKIRQLKYKTTEPRRAHTERQQITLTPEAYAALQKFCQDNQYNISVVIRAILQWYIEKENAK